MKKISGIIILIIIAVSSKAQSSDELAVRKILENQTIYWNQGSIEKFMEGYWNSDSLMFIGKSGVTYGYTNTLNNYKKNYSDTAHMGKLSFDIIKVKRLSPDYYFVVGKFTLRRSIGDLSGHYDLLFRKINGKWYIISDHTS
jgi:hypothetical protein